MHATFTTAAPTALNTLAQISARYELDGPHVTAILRVPEPGTVGDDLATGWHSSRSQLFDLGASRRSIDLMDELLGSMDRCGRTLLVTANDESAARTWLENDIEPSFGVGALPALVPVLHQALSAPASTIVAAIDRTGADLSRVGTFDVEFIRSITGEDEPVRTIGADGLSRARRQRHSEVVWERNASLVARSIDDEVTLRGADGVVLTGTEGEVRLVEAQLAGGWVAPVVRCAAGGRHEPGTPERLRAAALDFRSNRRRTSTTRALDELREDLGHRERALAGAIMVLEATTEHRVRTLFIDLDADRHSHHVDAIVRTALAHGTDMVIGSDFDIDDGVAAILRTPRR